MGVLFTDSITIYNHSLDENGMDMWVGQVIKGVQWAHRRKEFVIGGNVTSENYFESLTFDFDRDYGNVPFVDPVDYAKLSDSEKADVWTLNTDGSDIVVLGECDEAVTGGASIDTIKESYQYVGTVTSVTDNRNRPRLRTIKAVVK